MSNRDLSYYKQLEYNILIEKEEMDGETWYIAYTKELGKFACYGRGIDQVDAINNYLSEKNAFIDYLFSEGKSIPEPQKQDERFSGFFNVRTSPLIHANLVQQAKELDISLNLYVNQILSAAIENRRLGNSVLDKMGEICGKLDAYQYEVTRQLKYQADILKSQYSYDQKYYSSPYLKAV